MDIRPATACDLDTLLDFPVDPRVGFVGPDRFRAELDAGRMRWPWSWLALDDGAVVGRALWWGRADSNAPLALDCLHVLKRVPDRTRLAVELLERGHRSFAALTSAEPTATVTAHLP